MAIKSEMSIWLDYNRAMKQANELDQIASEMEHMADGDFQGCLNNVTANWTGENSRAYVRKGKILQSDIRSSAQHLRKIANVIRNIAKRTRNADLRARAIALSSGG